MTESPIQMKSPYQVLQVFPAKDELSYHCTLMTDALPSFHRGEITEHDGTFVVTAGTGSGPEAKDVLQELLAALAGGTATFDYGYQTSRDIKVYPAQEDGREVSLSRTDVGWYMLDIAEGCDFRGEPCPVLGIFFEAESLAHKVAQSISEGMLDFDRKKVLVSDSKLSTLTQ